MCNSCTEFMDIQTCDPPNAGVDWIFCPKILSLHSGSSNFHFHRVEITIPVLHLCFYILTCETGAYLVASVTLLPLWKVQLNCSVNVTVVTLSAEKSVTLVFHIWIQPYNSGVGTAKTDENLLIRSIYELQILKILSSISYQFNFLGRKYCTLLLCADMLLLNWDINLIQTNTIIKNVSNELYRIQK